MQVLIYNPGELIPEIKDMEPSVENIKEIIGGWMEIHPIIHNNKKWFMVMDEEGKLKEYPMNEIGTALWKANYIELDIIVGTIILLPYDEFLEYDRNL